MEEILMPLNHREIAYEAGKLPANVIPDGFPYESDAAKALFDWVSRTGDRVFDDDLIMDYGRDCLRLYLLFENTPKEQDAPFYESWNEGALEGMYKFLGRYRRMVLAASAWNRRGGYYDFPKECRETIQEAFAKAEKKIDQCIGRANTMPNRHNIVSALMELLNVLHKELKIGEIITEIRQHAVNAAAPKKGEMKGPKNDAEETKAFGGENEAVTRICRRYICLMAPVACDLSKILWQKLEGAT